MPIDILYLALLLISPLHALHMPHIKELFLLLFIYKKPIYDEEADALKNALSRL